MRREQRGDDAPWGLLERLGAALVDEVRLGNYYILARAGAKNAEPPTPIPRPGVEPPTFTLTDAQADALLARGPRRDDEE